ncbi:Rossmann-fold NAD(P)-binding domain-containing protein [Streptomyces antibioticus]|uniref:hypothetical protein n=1 Tax=Streptomyces antibioticus TaxID=1890 RepID=UPI00224E60B7|nr:hypothetical protein [Streptomyces antibioticus]MCX4741041.1 hypothetical protein [Streptomyces antibioticus]
MTSVRTFADSWSDRLDILINNAGVMDIPSSRTADGLDVQTATNHTGPFFLINLLLGHVTDRVVHVTSQLHRQGRIDLTDLDWRTVCTTEWPPTRRRSSPSSCFPRNSNAA